MNVKEKIKGIFKSNNEEKLVEKLSEIEINQIETDISTYARFERMRQSWNHEDKTGLYFKIKGGEYVTQAEIERITKDAKDKGVYATKEFKKYLDYLNRLKAPHNSVENNDVDKYKTQFNIFVNSGKEFINGFKVYKSALELVLKNNWVITKKEQQGICDTIANVQLKLKSINDSIEELKRILSKDNLESEKERTYYLKLAQKLAQEVQNWMYGENNFYQKGAQKVINKYKDVFDLIMKCNKNKFKECVKQLDSDVKPNICNIYGKLQGILSDVYGEGSKECKKSIELQLCFS